MQECPHCGAMLNRPAKRRRIRDGELGRRDAGAELVACPECGDVIDGFSSH